MNVDFIKMSLQGPITILLCFFLTSCAIFRGEGLSEYKERELSESYEIRVSFGSFKDTWLEGEDLYQNVIERLKKKKGITKVTRGEWKKPCKVDVCLKFTFYSPRPSLFRNLWAHLSLSTFTIVPYWEWRDIKLVASARTPESSRVKKLLRKGEMTIIFTPFVLPFFYTAFRSMNVGVQLGTSEAILLADQAFNILMKSYERIPEKPTNQ